MNWSEFINTVGPLADASIVQNVGWCLFHSLWQVMLISAVVWTVLRLIDQRYATTRYTIALVGLTLVLALPLVTWLAIEPTESLALVDDDHRASMSDYASNSAVELSSAAFDGTAHSPNWTETIHAQIQPRLTAITIAWLIGMSLFSVRPLLGLATILRLKRCGTLPVSNTIEQRLVELVALMNIRRPTQIMSSSRTSIPMVIGFLKPMILLPASTLTHLSATELDAVLAHELAHLRRYDDIVNLFQTVAESVFFYHPGVWWLSAQVRTERENCCDDISVAVIGGAKPLAQALLQLEQLRVPQPGLAATGGSLVSRIQRLTPKSHPSHSKSLLLWSISLSSLVIAMTSVVLLSENPAVAVTKSNDVETFVPVQDPRNQQHNVASPDDSETGEKSTSIEIGPIASSVQIATDPTTGTMTIRGDANDIAAVREIIRLISQKQVIPRSPQTSNESDLGSRNTPKPKPGVMRRVPTIGQLVQDQSETSVADDPAEESAVVEINHRQAGDIADTISLMFAETAGMGTLDVTANAPANAVLLRGTKKSGLGYAKRLINILDVPRKNLEPTPDVDKAELGGDRQPRVYRISNLAAKEVAESIQTQCSEQIASDELIIAVEDISNSIIVSTNQQTRSKVENLIRSIDSPALPNPPLAVSKPKLLSGGSDEPIDALRVELGQQYLIKSEFKVSEISVDVPDIVAVAPSFTPHRFEIQGKRSGVATITCIGPNEKLKVYQVKVFERDASVFDNEFRRVQATMSHARKSISALVKKGHFVEAIRDSRRLRQSLSDNERLRTREKAALLAVIDRGISDLAARVTPSKPIAQLGSLSVTRVTLDPSSSIQFTCEATISDLKLSKTDVVRVSPVAENGFRVMALNPGEVQLDVASPQGLILKRYQFVVKPTESDR